MQSAYSPAPTSGTSDPSRQASPPLATYALLAVLAVVWFAVYRFLLTGNQWTDFALRPGTLTLSGLVISPFIHVEPAHLGVNLAVLWLAGTNLERSIGTWRFLALYLLAGWFAALMQWAVYAAFHVAVDAASREATIGASGAIAGVLGATLVRFPLGRFSLPGGRDVPAAPVLVLWFAYTVLRALVTTARGVDEGVAHWAHLAGFVFGLGAAQLCGLGAFAKREFLNAALTNAVVEGNRMDAARARSALLQLDPTDLDLRLGLVLDRKSLFDYPGARRLAREGLELYIRGEMRPQAVEFSNRLPLEREDIDLSPAMRYRLASWLSDAGYAETAYQELLRCAREEKTPSAMAAALYRAGAIAKDRLSDPARTEQAWRSLLQHFPQSDWTDEIQRFLRKGSAGCRPAE